MKELTAQQIFTKSATHLMKQGRKAHCRNKFGNFQCFNFNPKDGNRCAVGCLIPKSYYVGKPEIHCGSFMNQLVGEALYKHGVTFAGNEKLLSDLLRVHDTKKPSRWKGALRNVAKFHKLKLPKVLVHDVETL